MTNRETAIALWRKLLQQSEDDPSSEKPESWPDEWRPIKSALDAAERRGWIAALEWAHSCGYGRTAFGLVETQLEKKLAELKAEESER